MPSPASASSVQAAARLLQLPAELLSDILFHLDTPDLACLAATCRSLWLDAPAAAPPPLPPREIRLVEAELRRRAKSRGLNTATSLPEGALLWVPYLFRSERRGAARRQTPLAVGPTHSLFVDKEGRLHSCGRDEKGGLLGNDVDPDAGPDVSREIGRTTLVPAMQERRVVCVASSESHCLALCGEGEVYAWGEGALGHGDLG